MSFGNKRNSRCPCQSGKKLKHCCITEEGFPFKREAKILDPVGKTGYANPKCVFRHRNNCSTKMSGEHYISRSILQLISGTMKNKVCFTNPKINSGEETVVGLDSIKTKVFCQHHNQICSPLDQAALVLVSSLRQRDPKYDRTIISGYDIERWMMKCFCAVVIGNVTGESSEEDKLFVQRAFDHIIRPVTSNKSGGMYIFSEVGSRISMDYDT